MKEIKSGFRIKVTRVYVIEMKYYAVQNYMKRI